MAWECESFSHKTICLILLQTLLLLDIKYDCSFHLYLSNRSIFQWKHGNLTQGVNYTMWTVAQWTRLYPIYSKRQIWWLLSPLLVKSEYLSVKTWQFNTRCELYHVDSCTVNQALSDVFKKQIWLLLSSLLVKLEHLSVKTWQFNTRCELYHYRISSIIGIK